MTCYYERLIADTIGNDDPATVRLIETMMRAQASELDELSRDEFTALARQAHSDAAAAERAGVLADICNALGIATPMRGLGLPGSCSRCGSSAGTEIRDGMATCAECGEQDSGFAPGQPYYVVYPCSGENAWSSKRYPTTVSLAGAEHNAREYSRDGRTYVIEHVGGDGEGRTKVSEFRNGRKVRATPAKPPADKDPAVRAALRADLDRRFNRNGDAR